MSRFTDKVRELLTAPPAPARAPLPPGRPPARGVPAGHPAQQGPSPEELLATGGIAGGAGLGQSAMTDMGAPAFTPPPAPADAPEFAATSADAQRANGTSLVLAEGAPLPERPTDAAPVTRLEVACLVIDPEAGLVHAYGYAGDGTAWTLCGLSCGHWDVLVGGRPTCPPCDMGRAAL